MKKMSDADIAVLAKQASDIVCLFAMIHMKNFRGLASRIGALANCTFPILFGKHAVIRPVWDAESPLEVVVALFLRILFVPLSVIFRVFFWIALTPFSDTGYAAFFAARLKPIVLMARNVELGAEKNLAAFRTMLMRCRIAGEFGHDWSPDKLNQLIPLTG